MIYQKIVLVDLNGRPVFSIVLKEAGCIISTEVKTYIETFLENFTDDAVVETIQIGGGYTRFKVTSSDPGINGFYGWTLFGAFIQ